MVVPNPPLVFVTALASSRIVREVREDHAEYVVTHQGRPVAILHPYTEAAAEHGRQRETDAALKAMKKTAREVAKAWTSPKSAVEILDEQRR